MRKILLNLTWLSSVALSLLPSVQGQESLSLFDAIPQSFAEPTFEMSAGLSPPSKTPPLLREAAGACNQPDCYRGCQCKPSWKSRMQQKYWGYPDHFCERPFGSFVRTHLDGQIAQGAAAQMVFYHYDFFQKEHPLHDTLKPTSRRQVAKVAHLSRQTLSPVSIQGTGDAMRDARRKLAVLEAVARDAGELSEHQIRIFGKDSFGISGDEAAQGHEKMSGGQPAASRGSGQGASVPVLPFGLPFGS